MCTKKTEKPANEMLTNPPIFSARRASPEDEDDFLYNDESVVASLNRAREQMRQGKFIPKEDVIEDV